MPLQNRVLPDGTIASAPWRGNLMGNRGGRLHDPETRELTNRRWVSKRWIICVTQFKGRQRTVMGKGYTELFFLDEVSALAAGHRPCFECQRERAIAFSDIWQSAHGKISGSVADTIDQVLHSERTSVSAHRFGWGEYVPPSGAFFSQGSRFYTVRDGQPMEWTGKGYRHAVPDDTKCTMITPASVLSMFDAGFTPTWDHSSITPK